MPLKLVYSFIILALFSFGEVFAQTDNSGYRVVVRHFKAKDAQAAIQNVTALIVTPLPPGQYEFQGIDMTPLGPAASLTSVKRQVALHYMSKIQADYFEISGNGPFQDFLAKHEPFTDGRSGAVALYEGIGLDHPRSTIRVSYAKSDGTLPFLNTVNALRGGYNPLDFYRSQPISNITAAHLPADLGAATTGPVLEWARKEAQKLYPNDRLEHLFDGIEPLLRSTRPDLFQPSRILELQEMFSALMQKAIDSVADPLRLLAMEANSREAPKDPNLTQHPQKISNDSHKKFQEYLKSHSAQMGGWPAEIKGLGHVLGTNKAEFIYAVFQMAVLEGLFDLVPARMGLPVPTSFVAASTRVKAKRLFPNVGLEFSHEFLLPGMTDNKPQEHVVMKMTREQLGAGIADYFIRTSPEMANEDFPRYRSTRESLTQEELRNRAAVIATEEVDDFKIPVAIPKDFNPNSCGFL